MKTFKLNFILGFKYALLFLLISAVMGLIYGAFGGRLISPMFVGITYVGIFVILNFFVALILGVVNLIPSAFGKGSTQLSKYFTMSFSFFIVFFSFFLLLKLSGLQVF